MVEDLTSIDWAVIATFGAVLVALGIGIYNGWSAKVLEKSRNKHELLKEIANWAISLHISPLEVEIPPTGMSRIQELELTSGLPKEVINALKEGEITRLKSYVDFQKRMSFGKAIALSGYIRAIAEAHFKKQLLNRVNEVIEEAIVGYFISERSRGQGFDVATKGFKGEYIEILRRTEDEEISKAKDLKGLADKYAEGLAKSVNNLLDEIARIMV